MIIISHKCLVAGCPETSHKWEWNGQPTLRELLYVQETLGMEPAEYREALNSAMTGLTTAGIKAALMMVHLLHRRDGILTPFEDVDLDPTQLETILDPAPDDPAESEGKGTGTPTTPSRPLDDATSSTSGPAAEEGSEPRSSTTPPTSGGGTG
ncbi:hypothetical protein SAMN04489712_105280 [Thermomonospora echinospora]|uniref:Uncharacterized protein n=1 Tax=Thermomonospora echinospora TaxID=1992 RepID=A0A1H6AB39_9ACTN|nr:hypothetical protein [Thermomonospora echinospora]SEG44966.1 hypothetical protein SAMN04489712_105280 [Thermomonospora echinospora]